MTLTLGSATSSPVVVPPVQPAAEEPHSVASRATTETDLSEYGPLSSSNIIRATKGQSLVGRGSFRPVANAQIATVAKAASPLIPAVPVPPGTALPSAPPTARSSPAGRITTPTRAAMATFPQTHFVLTPRTLVTRHTIAPAEPLCTPGPLSAVPRAREARSPSSTEDGAAHSPRRAVVMVGLQAAGSSQSFDRLTERPPSHLGSVGLEPGAPSLPLVAGRHAHSGGRVADCVRGDSRLAEFITLVVQQAVKAMPTPVYHVSVAAAEPIPESRSKAWANIAKTFASSAAGFGSCVTIFGAWRQWRIPAPPQIDIAGIAREAARGEIDLVKPALYLGARTVAQEMLDRVFHAREAKGGTRWWCLWLF